MGVYLKTIITMLFVLTSFAAKAYESTNESEGKSTIVEVECKGTAQGLSVNAFVWADPKGLNATLVKLDVSVNVSSWTKDKSIQDYYGDNYTEKGHYYGLVGEIEQGKGSYSLDLPKFKLKEQSEYTEFTTSLGLRTEFFDGKTSLKCKAMLKQISTKIFTSLKW